MTERPRTNQETSRATNLWASVRGREYARTDGFNPVPELSPVQEILTAQVQDWMGDNGWELDNVRENKYSTGESLVLVFENPSNEKIASDPMIAKTLFKPQFHKIFARQKQFVRGMGYVFNLYQLKDEAQSAIGAFPYDVSKMYVHAQRTYTSDLGRSSHNDGRLIFVVIDLLDLAKEKSRLEKQAKGFTEQSKALGTRIESSVAA